MSVWGKILGGAAGFALGGPLGALIGAVAGHAVDKMRAPHEEGGEDDATKATDPLGLAVKLPGIGRLGMERSP